MPVLEYPDFSLGNELTKAQLNFFDKNGVIPQEKRTKKLPASL